MFLSWEDKWERICETYCRLLFCDTLSHHGLSPFTHFHLHLYFFVIIPFYPISYVCGLLLPMTCLTCKPSATLWNLLPSAVLWNIISTCSFTISTSWSWGCRPAHPTLKILQLFAILLVLVTADTDLWNIRFPTSTCCFHLPHFIFLVYFL